MSGTAIKVSNEDYSSKGLGRVLILSTDPVVGLTISATKVAENKYQFGVTYNPEDTYQRAVTWEIMSNPWEASINSKGLMTLNVSAVNASITVKATSVDNPSISATYTDTFNYVDEHPIVFTDKVLLSDKGVESVNSGYFASDYFEVEPGRVVTLANIGASEIILEYPSDKSSVIEYWRRPQTITLKATTRYLRLCLQKKPSKMMTLKYADGTYAYNRPMAGLFGKYLIDVGTPASSFSWTAATADSNKKISLYDANGVYIDSFNQQQGTRTCNAPSGKKFKYLASTSALTATIVVSGTTYTEMTYNTEIH